MNFKYTSIMDRNKKKQLLNNWQIENTNDVLDIDIDSVIKYSEFYEVSILNKKVGWIGISNFPEFKCLSHVFINNKNRNNGYFKQILKDVFPRFGIKLLLIGLISKNFNKYSKIYLDCGFPLYYRSFNLDDSHPLSEFFSMDEEIGKFPIKNIIFLNDQEINELRINSDSISSKDILRYKLKKYHNINISSQQMDELLMVLKGNNE